MNQRNTRTEWDSYHPIVLFCYFLLVLVIAMTSTHPVFLAEVLLTGFLYSARLKGSHVWRVNLALLLGLILFMTLINGLFSHNGITVLFYLNGNRITGEALLYGAGMAILLCGVILWFSCCTQIMNEEKILYLFGRAAPVLALMVSMTMRFVPLFVDRFHQIHQAQRCMGRQGGSLLRKIRQYGKELSILVSWSLEASIETADSMAARGYGLRGRSSFHRFCFQRRDGGMLLLILALAAFLLPGCFRGENAMYYYPGIYIKPVNYLFVVSACGYGLLLLLPMGVELWGEKKWKQLMYKI